MNIIKDLRQQKHLTQRNLAMLIHVSVDSVRRWENGTRIPRADEVVRMGTVLDVDYRFIFDALDDKTLNDKEGASNGQRDQRENSP